MTPRELEEFRELRATVRERGTARIWVFVAGMIGWAGLTIATASLAALPVATFLPLLILALTFEAVFSLHVTVERIGRYIQVFLEDEEGRRGWEHVAMAVGPPLKGTSVDPLFTAYFVIAVFLNTGPALLGPAPPAHRGGRGPRRPCDRDRPDSAGSRHRLPPARGGFEAVHRAQGNRVGQPSSASRGQ